MTDPTAPTLPTLPPQTEAPTAPEAVPTKDERMWAMFCHLAALAGFVVPVPFASVIGPLVVWMIKKDEYALVDDQGKEAVNFQISVALYCVLCLPLVFVLIGVFLIGALSLFGLICVIVAAMKANDGEPFHYPLCIRFIK
jgi:uncharacterized Tic20 family protein